MGVEGLVLAGMLTLSQTTNVTSDARYNEAIKHAALATFHQTGAKSVADRELKSYDELYRRAVNEDIQRGLGWALWCYKTAQDGKISYSWSF